MKTPFRICLYLLFTLFCHNTLAVIHTPLVTKELQQSITPNDALQRLITGNNRFMHDQRLEINFLKSSQQFKKNQHPIAIVLSCIDSRVPPEVVFDQTVGNIFVTRIAANVINDDVLAGMEFATALSGAKLIVVMGHDSCGAIKGACENANMGYLTQLVAKIKPSIDETTHMMGKKECDNPAFIDRAAENNVKSMVKLIPLESPVIRALVNSGKVKIVGAMYSLKTGQVRFLNP